MPERAQGGAPTETPEELFAKFKRAFPRVPEERLLNAWELGFQVAGEHRKFPATPYLEFAVARRAAIRKPIAAERLTRIGVNVINSPKASRRKT